MKHHGFVETEVEFGGIEQIKQQDLVAAGDQRPKVPFQGFNRSEQIGNQHHHRAFLDDIHNALERRGQVGGLSPGWLFEPEHQVAQVTGTIACRQVFADSLVEGQQPDRVALQVEKVSQCRGKRVGVLSLGIGERTVGHRTAVIDQQVAAQIRLILEFLDEVTVGAGVEPPVQVTGIVAGGVLSILGKLDGETVVGAAVQAVPRSEEHTSELQSHHDLVCRLLLEKKK